MFYSLAIDPSNPSTIFGSGGSGSVARSTDGGRTWRFISTGAGGTVFFAFDPTSPGVVYAASTDPLLSTGGIFRSLDSGETWKRFSRGGAPASSACVILDNHRPGFLYAGGRGGALISRDRGAHWRSLGHGIPSDREVSNLIQTPDGKTLYAGTGTGGIYRLDLADRDVTTVPVVASIHGRSDSFFHSDVNILNLSTDQTATVIARYRCFGIPCSPSPTRTLQIPPRKLVVLEDIAAGLFGAPETGGAVEFESATEIVVTSRLYTPERSGPTVGQFVPGLAPEGAAPILIIPSLSHSADRTTGFRTNIGIYNPNDIAQEPAVEIFRDDGTSLGKAVAPLGPRASLQFSDVFGVLGISADVPAAYAAVTGDGQHPLFAYGSVVDNRSEDPIFIPGFDGEVDPGYRTVVLPTIASLHGRPPSFFHSDLSVTNAGNGQAATLALYYRCFVGTCSPLPAALIPEAGHEILLHDVVGSLLKAPESAGALEVSAPGAVFVTSRLYTPTADQPTVGQFVPGLSTDQAYPEAVLLSLSHSANPAEGFRTNVGAYNPSQKTLNLKLDVFDPDGVLLGTASLTLAARSGSQISDIFRTIGVDRDIPAAYCRVQGDGVQRFFAYASVVDNRSEDPIFVPGSFDTGTP
jgi:hypothetical protein